MDLNLSDKIRILTIYIFLDPITNVKTKGNVWLQEGEMLELQVLNYKIICL